MFWRRFPRSTTDLGLIYAAAFLRSFGIGLLGVVLGVYLFRAGQSSTQIGLVIGAGLAGAAVALLVIGRIGDRVGRRAILALLSVLAAAGGIGLRSTTAFLPLMFVAAVSMLNGMGTDRTVAYALEQAIIPGLTRTGRRTWALSWYNLVLDLGHALGALSAGIPLALAAWRHIGLLVAYRDVFAGYAALNLASGVFYLLLSNDVDRGAAAASMTRGLTTVSPETKRITRALAALFSIDAFGGGFLTDAIISYWFFRRFGVPEQGLGLLFFTVHLLNAGSYLGAAWLARRIGLLNTMVFTHLPSSVLLMAVPFAPSFRWAVGLFLAREALVEMDVPTRQSYLAAVVEPHERTFASAATNLTRNVAWAAASSLTGVLMQLLTFSAPLLAGGGLKIVYDLLLYKRFRGVKPDEERSQARTHLQPTGTPDR